MRQKLRDYHKFFLHNRGYEVDGIPPSLLPVAPLVAVPPDDGSKPTTEAINGQ